MASILDFIKERKLESLWFSLSFLMLFIGGMSLLFVFAGWLPDNLITKNIPLLSNSSETVILLLLLGNRLNTIRKENILMNKEINDQKLKGAQQLMEGQILERKRLSQQLHDGMNLTLSNIRLRLSLLVNSITEKKQDLKELVDDLGTANDDLRQFSHALSPMIFDKYGLVDAMEESIDQTQNAHPELNIVFDREGFSDKDIPEFKLRTLYHVFQELLSNITRHSGALEARIQLTRTSENIILGVSDNGKGYDHSADFSGIGLKNVQSRVHLINGDFKIENLGKGTKHTVVIPGKIG